MAKTYDNKRDFIQLIASMSQTEINDYIKRHGKPPKMVMMFHNVEDVTKK